MMRRIVLATSVLLLLAWPAAAIECQEWLRFTMEEKPIVVENLIDERLASNEAKKYPHANLVTIRLCLQPYVSRIVAEFDGTCAEGISKGMGALNEVFDRYFLSCALR